MLFQTARYFIFLCTLTIQFAFAQRDTLIHIQFPYMQGYYQFFQGTRYIDLKDENIKQAPELTIQFEQKITETIQKETVKWHKFNTLSQIGDARMEGYYFVSVNQNHVYRWHAGPQWNTLMIPTAIYKGLFWKYTHEGQKFKATVMQIDTLINTNFGSHRCFAIRTDTKRMYYNGKKAESISMDFYDALIGKIKSVSAIRYTRKKTLIYSEILMLTEYRQE